MSEKPTVPEVLPLVQALYAKNSVGCCLHIVLDDRNLRDDNVHFCIDQAKIEGHKDCLHLAELLLKMTKTQRGKLAAQAHAAAVVRYRSYDARRRGRR